MSIIFLSIFIAVVAIQILFLVIIFSRFLIAKITNSSAAKLGPSVSVIVCSLNELENLKELIPQLLGQNYHDFEIIVVDDRSTDYTNDFLKEIAESYQNIFKMVTIKATPDHISSKKYALSLGIKIATKDYVLLTDADCRPTTEDWIKGMASQITSGKKIVLGYSPYFKEKGFLNAFIRFETFFTAWQYFSFSLFNKPYMGVGRNLLYSKNMFLENLGFRNHQRVTGGDDDLFVNENAKKGNTAICIDPDTYMYSFPKNSISDWYKQKTRHLSVGKHYKKNDKIWLGFYSVTHTLSWLLLPFIFLLPFKLHLLAGIGFTLRFILFWTFGAIANKKLSNAVNWFSIPMFDILMGLYYLILGSQSIFTKKIINWK